MLLTFTLITLIIVSRLFHHPLTPSFQASNLPFLQILPTVAFLSSSGLTTWIDGFPRLFTVTSEHIRFLRYCFLFYTF